MSLMHVLIVFVVVAVMIAFVAGIVWLIVWVTKSKTPPISHAAGWYPDPEDPSQVRYHDGRVWTAHVRPRVDHLG